MKIKYTLKSLFTIALVFISLQVSASHMMGGDVSYRCISPGKFHITAKIYRDCRGIPFNGPSATLSASGCSSMGLSLTRTSIKDITPNCVSSSRPCNPSNTTVGSEGVEEHTYEITIDFNVAPYKTFKDNKCCEVVFGIGQCCRNGAITTGASGQDFWADAMMNICLPKMNSKCNTSPVLTNVPIGYLCCNQPFYFNNGALDTSDFDSLSYELTYGFNGSGKSPINYSSPLNYLMPMTPYCPGSIPCTANPTANPPQGFFMDPSSGDLVFTPTSCAEVGIIVLQINEFRKDSLGVWKLIGRTRRDMQMIVRNCGPNNSPVISGTQTNTICEGDKICITIKGTDKQFIPQQLKADTVTMTWNRGIPGATFTIKDPKAREKEGEFCWQTKIGDARDVFYSFTVTAQDDNCPIKATSAKGFRIKVKKRARDTRNYVKKKCGWLVFDATLEGGFQGVASYKWEIRDSTNLGQVYKLSFGKKDSFQFKSGGKYIVTHTINNNFNCPTVKTDTIIIPPVLDVQLAFGKDTFACYGETLTLGPRISNGIPSYSFLWARPTQHTPGDTLSTLQVKIVQDTTLSLQITDINQCTDSDTIRVFMKKLPIVDVGPDKRLCTYQDYTIDAQHADTVDYYWLPTFDTTRTLKVNKAGIYKVQVQDTTWGCYGYDEMELFVNDTVVAIAPPDMEICWGKNASIKADGRPKQYTTLFTWRDINKNVGLGNDTLLIQSPKTDNCYSLHMQVTQSGLQCEDYDTVCVKVNPLPVFTLDQIQPKCYVEGDINLHASSSIKPSETKFYGKRPEMVTCYGPPTICFYNTNLLNNNPRTDTIYYDFTDAKGCYNKDSLTVTINPNPVVILRDRVYCQDKGIAKMDSSIVRPKVKTAFRFSWVGAKKPGGVNWSDILKNKGSMFVPDWEFDCQAAVQGDYVIKFIIDDAITGCRTIDSCTIKIIEEPVISFNPMPDFCINDDTINLDDYVSLTGGASVIDGVWTAVSYRGDRNDTKLSSAILGNHKLFPGKYYPDGGGLWEIKFYHNATGCPAFDSTFININDLPVITVQPLDTMCDNEAPIQLVSTPAGGNWTGNIPSNLSGLGNVTFTPNPGGTQFTTNSLKYSYTDPTTGCKNADSTKIVVQTMPTIDITSPNPYQICEDKIFNLTSTHTNAPGVTWITSGDGAFTSSSTNNTDYTPGATDKTSGSLNVTISTNPVGVCPQVQKVQLLTVNRYPRPRIEFPDSGCMPLLVDFNVEDSAVLASQLTYSWDFGNGLFDNVKSPVGILYGTPGTYNVSLVVTNTAGNCVTTVVKPNFVTVFPIPNADYTTNPLYYTTKALPRFDFINQSTILTGSMKYLWDFGTGNPLDTSTSKDPRFAYTNDTGRYYVTLYAISDKGCLDTVVKEVRIGPDITVFIPNVFSPDGAGIGLNETFFVTSEGYKNFNMQIFNRWGQLLYETNDIKKGWDGKYNGTLSQQDVYVYYVNLTSFEDKPYKFSGTVTLLR